LINKADKTGKFKKIIINDGHHDHMVNIFDITYIESVGRYQRLHFNSNNQKLDKPKTLITEGTLDSFTATLEQYNFMRAHRSYLVNLNFTQKLTRRERNWFVLIGDLEIPVSRNSIKKLKNLI
jgi:DNA-binding LytR/AlgR family response regulator